MVNTLYIAIAESEKYRAVATMLYAGKNVTRDCHLVTPFSKSHVPNARIKMAELTKILEEYPVKNPDGLIVFCDDFSLEFDLGRGPEYLAELKSKGIQVPNADLLEQVWKTAKRKGIKLCFKSSRVVDIVKDDALQYIEEIECQHAAAK